MKIIKVGDKGKAACDKCAAFVSVTYDLRDVPFSDGSGTVSKVLVGVCDQCGHVCVLPHQSTPLVKRQLEKQRKSIEARIPAHLVDILNLASEEVGCNTDFVQSMIKYYLHALASKKISPGKLADYLKSDLAKGPSIKRISLKGQHLHEDIMALKSLTHLKSNADLIKSVILKIYDDILQNKRSRPMHDLKGIAAAIN
ncbi:MAG: hypothetical protein OEV42_09855 [Deltaproteobacteria bacterium]|nr:hypothetical protein [Deltaproteobacteria bacterium]